MIENAFYFMLKAFVVLETFTLLCWLSGYFEKRLDKEAKVNFKICDITIGQELITINILPSISSSKENQAMKFGQLIKQSVRNISIQKSCRK